MICIYVARQRYDAYLVADRLNQAGIRAHVFNEHASSIAGDLPPDVVQPQVWLADDNDVPRAQALLRSMGGLVDPEGRIQIIEINFPKDPTEIISKVITA